MAFWSDLKKAVPERTVRAHCSSGAQRTSSLADSLRAAGLLRAYEETFLGWFWSTDADGVATYLTPEVASLLGRETIDGVRIADLFVKPEADGEDARPLSFLLKKRSRFENVAVRAADSEINRYWALSGVPQFDARGQFTGFFGSGLDITEQRLSAERAARLAMYDALTGLPNRLRFFHVLERILNRGDFKRKPCAVLLIDLDRFKQVNDTLGHPSGDALLRQVADRLLAIVGSKEYVFRLGGDEFQVILRDCDTDEVRERAERIISSVSQPYSLDGSRCSIGASIGIALAPFDGNTCDELVRNADLALYAAKGGGRGRAHFFSKDLLQTAEDKRLLEDDLRDALAKGEMQVLYQPVVNSTTSCTTAVEALVRWNHPERGSISPGLFIPIAEEANLIAPLGEWILRQACADAASWPGPVRVAVNVSPIQFSSGTLPALVTSALASSGLSPDRLELEITEGVFLSDSAAADAVFASLKDIGVRLALDDFGTGYSSLGYLRTAPFDKIKIDQSFVRAATLPGSRNAAIIAAIVALAEALGMETTAEGVETHDQLELVRALRVSHIQGYIYSKAVSSDELKERLAAGEWVIPPSGPSKQRSDRLSMYRKVRAIFGNHYRHVLIRNLSETGALVEGLDDIPFDSRLLVDLGEGHLVFAKVIRSRNRQQGVEFEEPLLSDGQGGLRTSKPVSPYLLEASGMLHRSDGFNLPQIGADNSRVLDEFRSKLGMAQPGSAAGERSAGPDTDRLLSSDRKTHDPMPTIAELADRHRAVFGADGIDSSPEWEAVQEHVVQTFGHLRPDALTPTVIGGWLRSRAERDELDVETLSLLHGGLAKLYALAVQAIGGGSLGTATAAIRTRDVHERPLTGAEIVRLKQAAEESANPQLKYIISLLMHTRVRQRDLLEARWEHIDLDEAVWVIPSGNGGAGRRVELSKSTVQIFRLLPRWSNCPFVLVNPSTRKPYRSFTTSWNTARRKADLADVEIDDLRYCAPVEESTNRTSPRAVNAAVRHFKKRA